MTTEKDIKSYLDFYMDKSKLGEHILSLITKDVYDSNPDEYSKVLENLYKNTRQTGNLKIESSMLCKWLELSDFKDANALSALKDTHISMFFLNDLPQETMYKIVSAWIEVSDSEPLSIATSISTISDIITSPDTYINDLNEFRPDHFKTITHVYNLDYTQQLKLLNQRLVPNINILADKSLNLKKHINIIINSLDLASVENTETVKLLTLVKHLNKPALTKLCKACFPDKFNSILTTGQVLGIAENPDYWVQALASSSPVLDNNVSLPVFE